MINKKGFTLVEVLVVVAILAVISTAAGLGITTCLPSRRKRSRGS